MTEKQPVSDTYIAKSRAIAARVLGDEAIIMSAVDSTLFSLNSIGTIIWESADGKTPLSTIIHDKLCPVFDVTFEEANADAADFVQELVSHGLLEISHVPIRF